ncbi:MFS-type transporter SLC18B1 [Nymphon striatum]|nr:MFS-type transporter SLC18B1 [Nymphon striatum]
MLISEIKTRSLYAPDKGSLHTDYFKQPKRGVIAEEEDNDGRLNGVFGCRRNHFLFDRQLFSRAGKSSFTIKHTFFFKINHFIKHRNVFLKRLFKRVYKKSPNRSRVERLSSEYSLKILAPTSGCRGGRSFLKAHQQRFRLSTLHLAPRRSFYDTCVACRVVQGVSYLGIQLSSNAIITVEFKTHVSTFLYFLVSIPITRNAFSPYTVSHYVKLYLFFIFKFFLFFFYFQGLPTGTSPIYRISNHIYVMQVYHFTGNCHPTLVRIVKLGLREMCFGIGASIGPLFGAVLFENFGFEMPFLASAAIIATIAVVGYIAVRPENNYMTDDARADVSARGFWVKGRKTFVDIRVFNPLAKMYNKNENITLKSAYQINENSKMREYNERILQIEHGTFTPLVFSAFGGMGYESSRFFKRLNEMIAEKKNEKTNEDGGEQSDKLQNIKLILSNPEILLNFLQNGLALMFITYIDGWLATYIVYKFKKSVTFAGSYLMIAGAFHIICAPIVGHLADSKKLHGPLIALGVFILSIGQFLYGPSPFLHLDSSLWLLAISLVLLGVGASISVVPSFAHCQRISSIFLGPMLGGVLFQNFGFKYTSEYFGSAAAVLSIVPFEWIVSIVEVMILSSIIHIAFFVEWIVNIALCQCYMACVVIYDSIFEPMKMENNAESLNVGLSLKKKIMMAVLMVSSVVEGIIFCLIGSIFPEQALRKGLQKIDVGVILSSFSIAMIVLTFAVGAMIPKLGSRFSFLLSLTVSALILIPFSFVMHAPSKSIFYFSCVACRVVQGVSYLGIQLSSNAIITVEFKTHVSTFLGLREMCFGIGAAIGPLFGAVLFENFGFEMPFLASAAIIATIAVIGYIAVRPENNYMTDGGEQSDNLQNIKLIHSNPEILLNFLQNALALMFITYMDGWLATYIVYKFKKSVTFAGSYLMIAVAFHIICAPIVGHLADSKVDFMQSINWHNSVNILPK